MISTAAGSSPWLTTVRDSCGSSRANVPAGRLDLAPVDDQARRALEHEEDLLLVAVGLVVLGDPLAGRDLDQVHAERLEPERAADEQPVAGALEILAAADGDALEVHDATRLTQQARDDVRVLRAAEEEALGGVAAGGLQVAELLVGLDALGGHRQPERVPELDHGVDDRHVLARVRDAAHERAVDLHAVDREAPQVLERRVAGAEVVDGDLARRAP